MKHLKKVAIAVLGLSLACMPVLASCDNNNTDQVDPVEAKLESISVTKMPTKVTYTVPQNCRSTTLSSIALTVGFGSKL